MMRPLAPLAPLAPCPPGPLAPWPPAPRAPGRPGRIPCAPRTQKASMCVYFTITPRPAAGASSSVKRCSLYTT